MTDPRRGVALLTALAILVVVGGISALMFTRTLSEIRHSGDDTGIVQSLMLARGAANLSGGVLQGPVRAALNGIVAAESSTTAPWSFGTGDATSQSPGATSVSRALSTDAGSVADLLQVESDDLLCDETVPGLADGGDVALRVYFTSTACGVALPGGVDLPVGRFIEGSPRDGSGGVNDQTYALPFVVVAEGAVGGYQRNVVTSGEYQFVVGRRSFAQYALFTNVHRSGAGASGSEIWFTDNTLFDGPVHTNQQFRFYRDPWFGGRVTSAGCNNPGETECSSGAGNDGAYFYGVGFRTSAQMTPTATAPSYTNTYGTHAPKMPGGVGWTSDFVPLPENSDEQRAAAIGSGIQYGHSLTSLSLSAVTMSGSTPPDPVVVPADGSVAATRQLIEACYTAGQPSGRTRCDQWVYGSNGALQQRYLVYQSDGTFGSDLSSLTWTATGTTFNGVVHSDGVIDRLRGPDRSPSNSTDPATASPALASFAQITVTSDNDISITGDLKYEDVPCEGSPRRVGQTIVAADCSNLNAQNILGVYSQEGDVEIAHNNSGGSVNNAPANVTIHGVLMSLSGVVGVEDFASGLARGSVNLLGGIIEYYYGAFGTFNANTGTMSTGYSRAFTFDQRTAAGLAPPYFPTIGIGEDGVRDIVVFAFGQREQVE
jgi:hypothetical protein